MKTGDRYISTDGENREVTITLVGTSRVAFDGDAVGVCVIDEFNKRYRPVMPDQPARKPDFYVPVAIVGGDNIAITHHAGHTVAHVQQSIMETARREGFRGGIVERLTELEWFVRPVFIGDTDG